MSQHIFKNGPSHLHQWETTSTKKSQHINKNESPHHHKWVTTSSLPWANTSLNSEPPGSFIAICQHIFPTMSLHTHIFTNEPRHLRKWATTPSAMSHHICITISKLANHRLKWTMTSSPMSHHIFTTLTNASQGCSPWGRRGWWGCCQRRWGNRRSRGTGLWQIKQWGYHIEYSINFYRDNVLSSSLKLDHLADLYWLSALHMRVCKVVWGEGELL